MDHDGIQMDEDFDFAAHQGLVGEERANFSAIVYL